MKKGSILRILLSFSLCFCLVTLQVTCTASEMYTITETELVQLETNLNKLEQISKTQKTELSRLQEQLMLSQAQLKMLQEQLNISEKQLTTAQESLNSANELLKTYATEEKRKRLRIKAQRNAAWTVAGILLSVIIAKS